MIPLLPLAGDGVTDDTRAVQQRFDREYSSRHAVELPTGAYRITEPIVVDLQSAGPVSLSGSGVVRLVMAGPGPAIKLVGTHGGTADPSSVLPNVWSHERMPLIDGIEIVGEHPEADGIELTGTMKPTLTRLNIRKCRHAVRLTNRNRNVIVSDCHLYENSGIGLFLDNVDLHQINVTGCHISYNGGGGIVSRGKRAEPAHHRLRHRKQHGRPGRVHRERADRLPRIEVRHRRGGDYGLHDPAQ
ncbi:MAG: right-handed parallel beta-helix repeat-containing protein [Planctomycetaceae bacterium]